MYYIQGFYKIKKLSNYKKDQQDIKNFFISKSVRGTLIISPEGINGTIAGQKTNLNKCINLIKKNFSIIYKWSMVYFSIKKVNFIFFFS